MNDTIIPVENIRVADGGRIEFADFDDGTEGCQMKIPLQPFDAGLSYPKQPETTAFFFDDVVFPVADYNALDGKTVKVAGGDPKNSFYQNGGLYLGSVHNPVRIHTMKFRRVDPMHYEVEIKMTINFELQNLARDASLTLKPVLLIVNETEGTSQG